MMQMRKGDRWGALTLTDIYSDLVQTSHNGVTDKVSTTFFEIHCGACGRSRSISKSDFPGRRQMRDCGCGGGVTGKGHVASAYIDERTFGLICVYAKEQGITASKAIVQLCRTGLDASQTVATDRNDYPTPAPTAASALSTTQASPARHKRKIA